MVQAEAGTTPEMVNQHLQQLIGITLERKAVMQILELGQHGWWLLRMDIGQRMRSYKWNR